MIEVRNQTELDRALESKAARDGDELIVILGDGRFVISEGSPWFQTSSSPTVVTRGTSNARVETWETSNARVETWETSNARVVTRETSNATVVTRETSNARVETRETSNARVETWGTSNVTGVIGKWSQPCFWRHDRSTIEIPGAVILEPPEIKTAEDWLDYYGVEVRDGVATLYKAVDDNWVSSRSFAYEPGSEPACEDWDPDPTINCGFGLHFCPAPSVALGYHRDATKFVACPVAVAEIVVSEGGYGIPDKVRAPKVAAPVFEVDIDGEPIKTGAAAA